MEVEVRSSSEPAHLARAAGSQPRTLGRYRVVTELGRGSTSIVYLGAVDGPAGFNKLFALKLLRPALAIDPALVALFLAEARVGAHLNHPNVVSTLEIDESGPLPFIVMEYLDGQTLQQLLAMARIAFKPLPLHMHLAAISGALEGLKHAHDATGADGRSLQIVHRDFSPHNVFVTSSGAPKLLDFGCAQSVGAISAMPTSAGHAAYMSPEQASGEAVDARSDLYAAGVIVWEAVTRKRFWPDEASKADILRALATRRLPDARAIALGHVSEDLRNLVLKATAPHPSDRYPSASALQEDLQKAMRQITPPAFDLRDLGHRLTTVFASERARLQAIIGAARESALEGGDRSPSSRPAPAQSSQAPPRPHPPEEVRRGPRSVPVDRAAPSPPPAPLLSFPIAPDDRRGWLVFRRPGTIAAIAASLAVGAGFSAIHLGADERSAASTSVLPAPVASAAAVAHKAADVLAPEPSAEPVASASEAPATSASAEPPTVPVESLRRVPGPVVARTRAAAAQTVHVESAPRASADVKPVAVEQPIVVSGSNPASARPAHPIDAVNPYAP